MKILEKINTCLDKPDCAKLLLRLTVGGLLLLHGWHKVVGGIGGVQGILASSGLPTYMGYAIYIGEVVAPVLLILGILTRLSALTICITMLFAWFLTGVDKTFALDKVGAWGIEGLAFFFFTALAIAFLGGGKYAVAGHSSWR